MNKMRNDSSCSFPLFLGATFDPLAGSKMPEKFLNFKVFLSENDGLECAYYYFCINKFKWMPQRNTFFGIMNFPIAKDFFEVSR